MAKYGKCNFDGLKDLQKKMEKFQKDELDAFIESCAKALASRLLSKVIKRTPVGVKPEFDGEKSEKAMAKYEECWEGYEGGTLRRGWISKTQAEAESDRGQGINAYEITKYTKQLPISKEGDVFVIEILNPVEYGSYVEYGHRQKIGRYVPAIGKRLKNGWVPGKFMLTISEKEIRDAAPGILAKKIQKEMEKIFK